MKVVTIARLFGAGGHTIGEKVAKRLGFELVEEEIINVVARKRKVSPEWVQSVESERGNWLMNFINTIVSPSFLERLAEEEGQGYIDEDVYKETLKEVMEEIARESNTVIVGRGGQYFLHDHPQAVHVLLIADKPHRIKFLMERYKMSEARAKRVIRRGDKRRNNFYKKIGEKHFNDPALYTVVINMDSVLVERAVEIIVDLASDL